MSQIIAVEKASAFRSPPQPRRKLTPILDGKKEPTYRAPKSDPFGATRAEGWDVYSRDGLWHYHRLDTGGQRGARWLITLLPTGQTYGPLANRDDARSETASGLLERMRSEAFTLALRSRIDDELRGHGQRWLAIHLRLAGVVKGEEAMHRCVCGGFLSTVTRDGDVAHLDACDRCYTYGSKGLPTEQCPHAGQHRFCNDPLVAGTANGCGLWRTGCCPGNCRPS